MTEEFEPKDLEGKQVTVKEVTINDDVYSSIETRSMVLEVDGEEIAVFGDYHETGCECCGNEYGLSLTRNRTGG